MPELRGRKYEWTLNNFYDYNYNYVLLSTDVILLALSLKNIILALGKRLYRRAYKQHLPCNMVSQKKQINV